jgi:hypothetical protein
MCQRLLGRSGVDPGERLPVDGYLDIVTVDDPEQEMEAA